MADDPLPAALAEIRERNESRIRAMLYTEGTVEHHVAEGDVRRLLGALDAVLVPHSPRADRVLGTACGKHRWQVPTLLPVAGCGECVPNRRREVCPECRDEFGGPVLFGDCRARVAILAALTGKGTGDGR